MLIIINTIKLSALYIVIPADYQAYIISEVGSVNYYMNPLLLGDSKYWWSGKVMPEDPLYFTLAVTTLD